jgi:hypothetical protein
MACSVKRKGKQAVGKHGFHLSCLIYCPFTPTVHQQYRIRYYTRPSVLEYYRYKANPFGRVPCYLRHNMSRYK